MNELDRGLDTVHERERVQEGSHLHGGAGQQRCDPLRFGLRRLAVRPRRKQIEDLPAILRYLFLKPLLERVVGGIPRQDPPFPCFDREAPQGIGDVLGVLIFRDRSEVVPSHDPPPIWVGPETMGGPPPVEPARHLKPDHALDVTITAESDDPRQLVRNVVVSGGDHHLRCGEGKADQPIGPIRGAWQ